MDIVGQQIIAAPRERVWTALNDPVILKACLPGCESVEQTSPEEFKVVIKAVIGPMRARFKGVLRLSDVQAPSSCVMHFEGQGAPVGFGKGQAQVRLSEVAEGTQLDYEAKAMVGGSLAQVGSRLLDSVVKKMSDDFFKAFQEQLAPASTEPAAPAANADATPHTAAAPEAADATLAAPAAMPARPAAASTRQAGGTLVPGWWLAPAAALGSFLTICGSWLMR
jgi:carbon monoxide dehydrogenase subunit G